jgi:hypothetical protein
VERAAQRAVRGLRIQDEHRRTRLANLAWRFELMTLDLQQHQTLHPIGSFLTALSELMVADGAAIPESSPPLPEPLRAVLSAVYEAGKQAAETDYL